MLHVNGIVLMDWMQVWYDNGFVGSMSEEFQRREYIAIFIFFQQMFNLNQTKYHNKENVKHSRKFSFRFTIKNIFCVTALFVSAQYFKINFQLVLQLV